MTKLLFPLIALSVLPLTSCGDSTSNVERQSYDKAKNNEVSVKFGNDICACHEVYLSVKDSLSGTDASQAYYNCLFEYVSDYTEADKTGDEIIARKECPRPVIPNEYQNRETKSFLFLPSFVEPGKEEKLIFKSPF